MLSILGRFRIVRKSLWIGSGTLNGWSKDHQPSISKRWSHERPTAAGCYEFWSRGRQTAQCGLWWWSGSWGRVSNYCFEVPIGQTLLKQSIGDCKVFQRRICFGLLCSSPLARWRSTLVDSWLLVYLMIDLVHTIVLTSHPIFVSPMVVCYCTCSLLFAIFACSCLAL
jgi:hypothetical protein